MARSLSHDESESVMARCGCAGSGACSCILSSTPTVQVTGNGAAANPYVMTVRISADSGNALTVGSDGGLFSSGGGGGGGTPGPAGKSAYDLWLEEGNTGTVSDFLDSLVGPPGPAGPPGGGGGGDPYPLFLVLPTGDPVPPGTPAGTPILRTP